eukprot:CAMPEP_0117559190 /NCGR_PEP_ID=MMETSP0784-20121206/53230_1 /TAXON_ID=39447 /ORGANISM="" /LENGTH=613 /DNA_ID=CAMNT_0005356555 /DNA_START=56 /DNA_END=1895 /DNA_ORIENTATION=+
MTSNKSRASGRFSDWRAADLRVAQQIRRQGQTARCAVGGVMRLTKQSRLGLSLQTPAAIAARRTSAAGLKKRRQTLSPGLSHERGKGSAGQVQGRCAPSLRSRQVSECANSACRIQSAFRDWQACRMPMAALAGAQGASRCIQQWWRMMQCKRRLQAILARLWWRIVCDFLQVDAAARRVQGGVRMMRLRSWRHRAIEMVPRLQAWWRGAYVRSALEVLRRAALLLQRWRRRHVMRRRLASGLKSFVGKGRAAATLVQKRWRGMSSRLRFAQETERIRRGAERAAQGLPFEEGAALGVRRPAASPPVPASAAPQHVGDSRPKAGIAMGAAGGDVAAPGTLGIGGASRLKGGALAAATAAAIASSRLTERGRRLPNDAHGVKTGGLRRRSQLAPDSPSSACGGSTGGSSSSTSAAYSSVPPAISRGHAIEVDNVVTELLSHGMLACSPKAPPWGQEQPGKSDLDAVRGWLASSLPNAEVRTVLRVECALAAAAYAGVRKSLGQERLLWHGTSWDSVANIVRHGFNRAYSGRHGAKLGRGTYFAEEAAYAMRFCGKAPTRAVFLAGVLPGRCCRGEDGLVEPPQCDSTGTRFDSTVDDPERPRVFCVFKDFQALP